MSVGDMARETGEFRALLAERVEAYDLRAPVSVSVPSRFGYGAPGLGRRRGGAFLFLLLGLEAEPEFHRRIDECLDRVERHEQGLRLIAEVQRHREALVSHFEVVEPVLHDDR